MVSNQTKRLLRIRAHLKKKRPAFVRVESWRYKRVPTPWRRARGIDSQTRRHEKGGVKQPGTGYRVPQNIRGIHPSGLVDVRIMHAADLEGLSPEVHGIRIAAGLGIRKRNALVELAKERNFRVFNPGRAIEEVDIEVAEDESGKKAQIKAKRERSPEADGMDLDVDDMVEVEDEDEEDDEDEESGDD